MLICINLLNKFTRYEFKLKISVAVCWTYDKWRLLIFRSTVLLVDYIGVQFGILVLLYKLTPSIFLDFFQASNITLNATIYGSLKSNWSNE